MQPHMLRRVVTALGKCLDERTDSAREAFFYLGYRGEWPARAGYAVGWLVARRLGAQAALRELAAMPSRTMRDAVAQILVDLEKADQRELFL